MTYEKISYSLTSCNWQPKKRVEGGMQEKKNQKTKLKIIAQIF